MSGAGVRVGSNGGLSSEWITGGFSQVSLNGNTSLETGEGPTNTDAIIAQPDHISSAAEICKHYSGGDSNDWFLPSIEELNLMYQQKDVISEISATNYWSSSEGTATGAWRIALNTGTRGISEKSVNYKIRAIREF